MRLKQRIVSYRGHTLGYVAKHKELTRLQVVELTKKGRIDNARVVHSECGPHLVGVGERLYDLPEVHGKTSWWTARRDR